ncbi:hypothetical protein HYU13_02035 [Candidatus Woesearchaeota archaeon]|nr:hypothetical protein [Candidatus Woesearchaeota archaeon]
MAEEQNETAGKAIHSIEHERKKAHAHPAPHDGGISISGMVFIGIVAILILFNQYQLSTLSRSLSGIGGSPFGSFSGGISLFSGKGGVIVGPQLNPDGRTTKLVEWPTISDAPAVKDTGDAAQDAIRAIVPTGVPWYLAEEPGLGMGISFDDPIKAQKTWGNFGRAVKLEAAEEARFNKIESIYTCDYCCGGPNAVTTINRCGCAHAYAWKGVAKFFLKYYPDKFTDEEIIGEMTRWKALFYPKGMIQNFLVYSGKADVNTLNQGGVVGIKQQFAGQSGSTQASASLGELENLPGMVGGC